MSVRCHKFASIVAITASAAASISQAQAVTAENAVADLFASHARLCGAAMSDAQGFIDGIASSFPAGHAQISATPDGQLFRVSLSEQRGTINTQFSRYIIGQKGRETCATYLTDYARLSDAGALAQAFEGFVGTQYGAAAIRGGRMSQFFSDASAGSDILQEDANAFEYLMDGVLPLDDVITVSAVQAGYVSLVSERGLAAP